MYRVYFTNFDYYSQDEFSSLDEAVNYGSKCFFEFRIEKNTEIVAFWSVFDGLKII